MTMQWAYCGMTGADAPDPAKSLMNGRKLAPNNDPASMEAFAAGSVLSMVQPVFGAIFETVNAMREIGDDLELGREARVTRNRQVDPRGEQRPDSFNLNRSGAAPEVDESGWPLKPH